MPVLFLRCDLPIYLIVLVSVPLSGGEDNPIIVNGLQNQSLVLSLPADPSYHVQQVLWIYDKYPMLTYSNDQITYVEDKFKERLEIMDNGRTLRIGQLRREDSGLYTVTSVFTNQPKDIRIYNIHVYEPVPTPSIRITEKKQNSDWCNVTLHCSVPTNASSLSYTWKYRHGGSDYETYDDSADTIQISLTNDSWDREFLCIVQNPSDYKNYSLQRFCPEYSGRSATDKLIRNHYILLVLLVLIMPLLLFGWCLIKMKRKCKKAEAPTVSDHAHREPQYIQVTTVLPDNDKQILNNTVYDSSPRQKSNFKTVYAVLEHQSEAKR